MNGGFKTKKELVAEILNCAKSPAHFLKQYAMIQHPTRGLIPFSTFNYQDDLLDAFDKHRFNIILKSRQVGITTIIAGYICWLIYFHQDKSVMVLANKQEVAKNLIRTIRIILKNLPSWLSLSKVSIDNKQSIELSNGSRVKASTTAMDAARSEALSLLVVDEAAIIKKFDEVWVSAWPALSRGGRAILSSTPKGASGMFHKIYQQAQNNENSFNCRFGTYVNPNNSEEIYNDRLMWWVHPENDMKWFENETAGKLRRDIAQEYACFHGDTRVATKFGFKKIKDIIVGDEVLTHKGRFKKVVFANSRTVDKYRSIKTFLNKTETKVTGEHPILHENAGWQASENLLEQSKICSFPKNVNIATQVPRIDLSEIIKKQGFDIIVEPDYIFINDRKHKQKISRFIEIDYDLGILIGLYLAEGDKSKNYVAYSFNYQTELTGWVLKVCDITKKKFNINKLSIYKKGISNAATLQVNSQIFSSLISYLCLGNNCYSKSLSKKSYELGNKDFYKGILDGVFLGDGCLNVDINKNLNITSENLIYDIKYIFSVLGYDFCSLRKPSFKESGIILGRKVNLSQNYVLSVLRTKNILLENISDVFDIETVHSKNSSHKQRYGENENFFISSILQNKKVEEPCVVYNLQVDCDESFVTEHFVVHNCSFLASGDTFIFSEDIVRLEKQVREPIERTNFDRNLWIWKYPQRGATYLISSDVSRGDSRDFSGFHIIRIDNVKLEQVAEYKGKITPDILGDVLVEASKKYNNAIIAIENNGGWAGQTVLKIRQLNYPFIYYASRNKREFIDPYYAQFADQRTLNDVAVPGYSVTPLNRIPILAKMEQYIRLEQVDLYSSRLIDEIRTFIWNNSRPEAQKGYHDDLVMSLAGGIWVREESFMNVVRGGSNLNQALLAGFSVEQTMTNHIPQFNFNGSSFYDRSRIQEFVQSQNKIIMGDGREEDLSWVFDPRKKISMG